MRFKFLIKLGLISLITACETKINTPSEKLINESNDTAENILEDDTAVAEELQEETYISDFTQAGPYEILEETRYTHVTNCTNMKYSVYIPKDIINPPVVVLGHGFARGPDVMAGWAEHLSSWGVEVLLPTLCHYNIFSGVDHEMNGQNMKELAYAHGSSQVVYAGHSAGGLAAIIAASLDNNNLGVLGLDATDTQNIPNVPDLIGQQYAREINSQAFSLIGEPSSCNAENNGINLFNLMNNYSIIKVVDSDHCDFESPTDLGCTLTCENNNASFSDEEIRTVIFELGTVAILHLTNLSNDSISVWEDAILNSSLIQRID